MGRINKNVTVSNVLEPARKIQCEAEVDSWSAFFVLPLSWKNRLGKIAHSEPGTVELAYGQKVSAEICGPVRIEVDGFRAVLTELLFLDLPENSNFKPLIGHLVLNQALATMDLMANRLVQAKNLDLKHVDLGKITR
ncbi:MAG TPA: hypothetical protein VHH73_12655 [Verrucomicrobiae bacterium]|nr:hypothetical protein [Verrucomicrobiae bacterium]